MMRGAPIMLLLFLLAGCAGTDATPMWSPGERAPLPPRPEPAAVLPVETAPVLSAPRPRPVVRRERPSAENPPARYEPAPYEPSAVSRSGLTDGEFRALQSVRQSLDSSIRDLERRSAFDRNTGGDEARLRAMKARRRDVVRRLRGG